MRPRNIPIWFIEWIFAYLIYRYQLKIKQIICFEVTDYW